ncbi:hypothetical protein BH10BAC1_BH10BAC1_02240 [soil metagenome]
MAFDFIYDILFELIVPSLDTIGASVRWIFNRRNRTYKEIYKLKNNAWIGFIFSLIIFVLLFYFLSY